MITVRYPSGHAVVYNDAHYLLRDGGWALLYESSEREKIIAVVPAHSGAAIEFRAPCNIRTDFNSVDDALRCVINHLAEPHQYLPTYGVRSPLLKKLKTMLRGFDARKGQWKV